MTPEFEAAFDRFRVSAFRLESQQTYAVGGEEAQRLAAFREGKPRPERSVRTDPWLRRIAATTITGKAWTRVRLIRMPLSEYMRYGLTSLVENQAVGEQVRIVDLAVRPECERLGPDFWLFDEGHPGQFAFVLHYHRDGSVDSIERTTDVDWCRHQQRIAVASSVSLNEYLAGAR